jgi:hypothetical protein
MVFQRDADLPKQGQRVEATTTLNWDADEFEDFPTRITAGQQGIVTEVFSEDRVIFIRWDDDNFPERKKSVSLNGFPPEWVVKVLM